MATLHVRNVPDDLYARLQEAARDERRSLGAQVVVALEWFIRDEEHRQAQAVVLDRIRRRREAHRLPAGAPDSVELLREDREQ